MKILLIFFATILVFSTLAQNSPQQSDINVSDFAKLNQIIPPSPQAFTLGRYGESVPSLSTGSINLNIPIYDFKTQFLSLPISLSYVSSGIKVDDLETTLGTTWVLNAGGVISRTVYGKPDEETSRLKVPISYPQITRELINFMDFLNQSNSFDGNIDGQPDIFNFNVNGYSGKFILDENNNAIQLANSSLKISSNFNIELDRLEFEITTPDGIVFQFNTTETTTTYHTCIGSTPHSFPVITAWYLSKIIHPNGDYFDLTYKRSKNLVYKKLGITQSTFKIDASASIYRSCTNINMPSSAGLVDDECILASKSSNVYLDQITCSNGGYVQFNYNNIETHMLLSSIEIYSERKFIEYFETTFQDVVTNLGNRLTSQDASLENRSFLTKLIEKTADGDIIKKHEFSYIDFNNLPSRLSFSQDLYGYFNGKNNLNLLPEPSNPVWKNELKSANANRTIDANFAQKGLLNKIVYPTGGIDEYFYESNSVNKAVTILPPLESSIIQTSNTHLDTYGEPDQLRSYAESSSLDVYFDQYCSISAGFSYPDQENNGSPHFNATVQLFDTESNLQIYSNMTSSINTGINDQIILKEGHHYKFKIIAYGFGTVATLKFQFRPGNVHAEYMNIAIGGVRVSKIITKSNQFDATPIIKKFDYSYLFDNTKSSGIASYNPNCENYLNVYLSCDQDKLYSGEPADVIGCDVATYKYYCVYSNSLVNLYSYSSTPVTYKNVTEIDGDNGKTEYEFEVAPDVAGNCVVGNPVPWLPLSSYSWRNGLEKYRGIFKKDTNGYLPVKKVFNHHLEDNRYQDEFKGYIVRKKFSPFCQYSAIPNEIELLAYDLYEYSIFKKWVYVDKVTTQDFDANGTNYIESIKTYIYKNPSHALQTSQSSVSSDNKVNVLNTYYPPDLSLSGDDEIARQALVSKHIISTPLLQTSLKNDMPISSVQTSFFVSPNNLVLPRRIFTKKASASFDERIRFNKYDSWGNLLEQQKANDLVECYIYGYNHLYPVAKIIGKSYNDALTQSGINISVISNLYTDDDRMRQELAKLHTLNNCFVTTYTYSQFVGITSECDVNNKTTYYEYDSFNRLKVIKDQDGKIIKAYDYQYQQNP